jgi:hypothetical protein
MKITIILPILVVFALSPMAQAVSPAPDGGYPGGNTAEGQNALFSLTTGTYNTAVGFLSLRGNADGNFNTAIGAGALLANSADQNTATGAGALLSTASGGFNTANGAFALFRSTNAAENCAFGNYALSSNTEANDNSAFGFEASMSSTGAGNTAVGAYSLVSNTTGVLNTAIGFQALAAHATGDNNTALGRLAGNNVTTASNVICIGALVGGANVDNGCYIGNIWQQPGGSQAVYVNSDGKLGALVSSRRFKDEIKPIEQASEIIYGLRPVSFRYKREIEPTRPRAFGLIAEDVEKVSPDLVTRGSDGQVNSVRYDAVNSMLLNEFLKEHRKVQELEATITEQKKGMAVLTAQLKEQAAQIQEVSAQLEMSRFTKRVVLNNP